MKYNVRIYLHTFVDYEVEAENEKEAVETAQNLDYDMKQVLENMVPADEEDVTEIPYSIYDMKLALEEHGWEWNVLDMMDEEEIRLHYGEINEEN